MRLVIGISGASGVWLGYKLLQILKSYRNAFGNNRRCYKKFCIGNYAGYC